MAFKYDVIIIGSGIIGLATGLKLLEKAPHLKLAILDKENGVAKHQSGHNSGVIHQGIYYKPGSLKARNCRKGVEMLLEFCKQHRIRYEICGKVIVATKPEELPLLDELERRGNANGVAGLRRIGPEKLKEIEPEARGVAALYSPNTGIIDFVEVAKAYAKLIKEMGGEFYFHNKVTAIESRNNNTILTTSQNTFQTSFVINCCGFYADKMARATDPNQSGKAIIPFRGEYFSIIPEKQHLIKGLIYPAPDPRFPFLGVHVSRKINHTVEAGPNAVLALSREGYKKTSFSLKQCWDLATYPGFWKMALRYWKIGCYELYRSYSKKAFLKDLQKLVPSLQESDLVSAPSGVRSQLIWSNGTLCDDFAMIKKPGMIHVLNAPSPGATASLAIGEHIASLIN